MSARQNDDVVMQDLTLDLVIPDLWKDIPRTWRCPECGAGKEDFEMMEL